MEMGYALKFSSGSTVKRKKEKKRAPDAVREGKRLHWPGGKDVKKPARGGIGQSPEWKQKKRTGDDELKTVS